MKLSGNKRLKAYGSYGWFVMLFKTQNVKTWNKSEKWMQASAVQVEVEEGSHVLFSRFFILHT